MLNINIPSFLLIYNLFITTDISNIINNKNYFKLQYFFIYKSFK